MLTLSHQSSHVCNVIVYNSLHTSKSAHNPLHNLNYSKVNTNKKHRNYRSCTIQNQHSNLSMTKNRESNVGCTYGDDNSQWLSLELQRLLSMQIKPSIGIVLTRGKWKWDVHESSLYQFSGIMRFYNVAKRNEIFITKVQGQLRLFSTECLNGLNTSVQIISRHPGGNPAPRKDGYWPVYIIRAGHDTSIEVVIQVKADCGKLLEDLQAILVEVEYVSYGPHGCSTHLQHVILPLQYTQSYNQTLSWKKVGGICSVLPVPTHLLCHLDDPVKVIKSYVLPHAKAGDIIAISETPLAIMQGHFRHPHSIHPGILARLVCRLFHPTSSLATACGMQTLIDISGILRVVFASLLAIIARVMGIRGMFYRLAGEQARLIDDASGNLPPYDQFITLGPVCCQETVDNLKSETGYEVAIVDVNDLKRVQILAASFGVDRNYLELALRDNPAGNDDEQTPIVLIRGHT
ncbi:uncharacterized protein LOC131061244 isoform X2 [Cryptomeria japonica]|uniref:uncharacterized protein LOC131061244 isoform X2 n=1 Tax=Cryptomeria japonica TaxID=3369 RepID=UPI0025AC8417|nr:uncharacterized protein LOC131061244 isoform X2 [Cryptomeria japonica]